MSRLTLNAPFVGISVETDTDDTLQRFADWVLVLLLLLLLLFGAVFPIAETGVLEVGGAAVERWLPGVDLGAAVEVAVDAEPLE